MAYQNWVPRWNCWNASRFAGKVPITRDMGARRLIYTLLAMMPVFFTVSVAVSTRMTQPDWTTPEFGPQTTENLIQYSKLVHASLSDCPAQNHPDEASTLKAGQSWLDSDLPAVGPGDLPASGLEGPLYEIVRARHMVVVNLMRCATDNWDSGNKDKAAHCLAMAMKVCEVARYSSVNSVSTSTDFEREAIKTVHGWGDELSASAKQELSQAIAEITLKDDLVVDLAKRLQSATRDMYSTERSLSRYAANTTLTTVSLSNDPAQSSLGDLSTDEVTNLALSEEALSGLAELEKAKGQALSALSGRSAVR